MVEVVNNGAEKREVFRVRYPDFDRPEIQLEDQSFEVIDISEEGIRFIIGMDEGFSVTGESHCSLRQEHSPPIMLKGKLFIKNKNEFSFYPNSDTQNKAWDCYFNNTENKKMEIDIMGKNIDQIKIDDNIIKIHDVEGFLINRIPLMTGKITLHNSNQVESKAKLLRVQKKYAIITLRDPIPFRMVTEEQTYLLQHYGKDLDKL